MDLEDAGCSAKYLVRDRDGKFGSLFDIILASAGITVVLTGIQMPRMNAIMERWVQTCRRELLDRTLIWNQRHLIHALRSSAAVAASPTRWPCRGTPVAAARQGIVVQSRSAMRHALDDEPRHDLVVLIQPLMSRADDITGTRSVSARFVTAGSGR